MVSAGGWQLTSIKIERGNNIVLGMIFPIIVFYVSALASSLRISNSSALFKRYGDSNKKSRGIIMVDKSDWSGLHYLNENNRPLRNKN